MGPAPSARNLLRTRPLFVQRPRLWGLFHKAGYSSQRGAIPANRGEPPRIAWPTGIVARRISARKAAMWRERRKAAPPRGSWAPRQTSAGCHGAVQGDRPAACQTKTTRRTIEKETCTLQKTANSAQVRASKGQKLTYVALTKGGSRLCIPPARGSLARPPRSAMGPASQEAASSRVFEVWGPARKKKI